MNLKSSEMNRNLFIGITTILMVLILISCASGVAVSKPVINPEIAIEELHKKGIVPISAGYKQSYFSVLPYLFVNEGDTFNIINGDCFNVKFGDNTNYNIKVGYWKKYEGFENVQVVLISMSENSKIPLKEQEVIVNSSKHGAFRKVELNQKDYWNKTQQRILLINPIPLQNEYDILKKIYDDVITVSVSDQKYTFVNPELVLE